MKIIGVVESDDYSGAAIVDSEQISVVHMNGYWMAASKCMFSHLPVTCEISAEQAENFVQNGVKCLNFDSPKTTFKKTKKHQ